MKCLYCEKEIPDNARFCPECGQKVIKGNDKTPINNSEVADSVISRSPGAGSIFAPNVNVGMSSSRDSSYKPELIYEDFILTVLESGGNLDSVRQRLDAVRGRISLTLGQSQKIEGDCLSHMQKTTPAQKDTNNNPPFGIGEDEFDYIDFFNDLRVRAKPYIPSLEHEPDGHLYYKFASAVAGAHFEWYFELFKWRRLGVELHFETSHRNWNQGMITGLAQSRSLLEKQTGERVYIHRNWGRTHDWARIYLANSSLDNIEGLKKWAVKKMVIFYQALQPELKKAASKLH